MNVVFIQKNLFDTINFNFSNKDFEYYDKVQTTECYFLMTDFSLNEYSRINQNTRVSLSKQ